MKYPIVIAGLLVSHAHPALAQSVDSSNADDEKLATEVVIVEQVPTVLTVWGERTSAYSAPSNVAVLTAQTLENWQTVAVADALTRIAGVTATSNGPLGSFTGVRIRGADAAQTLVVIDGVRVGDPSSPGGGFDFGNLTTTGIARIEVLNGSNSLAWGSDAIGGVVVIETNLPYDLDANASVQGGSHGFAQGQIGSGVAFGDLRLGGNLGYLRNDGISAATAGSEDDGFRQVSGNVRAELDLGAVTLGTAYIHRSGQLELDGFPPPFFGFADTAEYQETQENAASLRLSHRASYRFQHAITASLSGINRDSFDPANGGQPGFSARGRSYRLGWSGQLEIDNDITLLAGAEHEESRIATADPFSSDRRQTHISAGWVQAIIEPVTGLVLGGGLRASEHRDFGGNSVAAANIAWRPAGLEQLKLRANFAEGYKAPTLFQLSDSTGAFGNPDLRPERSRSYDVGVDYGDGDWGVDITLFQRDSRDLIDFVGCSGPAQPAICATGNRPFGTYANVTRARAEGVEASLSFSPTDGLSVNAGYAYVATRDRSAGRATFGNRLARRPVHSASFAIDYVLSENGARVGGDFRFVGASFDDSGNGVRLDDYALVALRASAPIAERLELFGRVENLFDENYQAVSGYGTYGRTAVVGLRWQLL